MKSIVCYIIYGENQGYYNSAKFSILNLLNYTKGNNIEIVVLSEKIEEFKGYPVTSIEITKHQIDDWSLSGKYHFRIKNLGIQHIVQTLNLSSNDKIIFFDTDIYFQKNPLQLLDMISNSKAIMYQDEGFICKKKRFDYYKNNLSKKTLECKNGKTYSMTLNAKMWGSAIIGLPGKTALKLLQNADNIMLCILSKIDVEKAHTIEQFSLSESVKEIHKIIEGKKYVSIYSTDRKKINAEKEIAKFFKNNNESYNELLSKKSLSVNLKRTLVQIIKDRFQ